METRGTLRRLGRGILATALVLTVTEVSTSSPAHADDPTVLIESPPIAGGPATNHRWS